MMYQMVMSAMEENKAEKGVRESTGWAAILFYFFLKMYLFIYFILIFFGCIGSSLLHTGFL